MTSLDLLGNALPSLAQDLVGLLCYRGASLAHGQCPVPEDPQVLFCKIAFQLVDLQPELLHRVIPPLMQDQFNGQHVKYCGK